jgi:hypothetical protein
MEKKESKEGVQVNEEVQGSSGSSPQGGDPNQFKFGVQE